MGYRMKGFSGFGNEDKKVLRKSNRKLIKEQRERFKSGETTRKQFRAAKKEIRGYTDVDVAREHLSPGKAKFEQHKMYKDGKTVTADTHKEHVDLGKKGYSHSPAKGVTDVLNKVSTGLTAAGMIPVVGNIADGMNTALSAGRAGYAKYKGDNKAAKKHMADAAINAAAMVPGAGLAVGAGKLAAKGAKAMKGGQVAQKIATEGGKLAAKGGKKAAVMETKGQAKKAIDKSSNKKQVTMKGNKPSKQNKA